MAHNPITSKQKSDLDEIKQIVESRDVNWSYIKRIHEGITFWMNVIHVTKYDLVMYYTVKIKSEDLQKRFQLKY